MPNAIPVRSTPPSPLSSRKARVLALRAALALLAVGWASTPDLARAEQEVEVPREVVSVYRSPGLLGQLRPGPTIGVGAPDGARFGLFLRWRGLLSAGGALSVLPETEIPGLDTRVRRLSGEGYLRVHPLRGALFVGVAGGYAQTSGGRTEVQQGERVDLRAQASGIYVAPHIGFQWMLPMGMTIGCDAGVQIPVATQGPLFDAEHDGVSRNVDARGAVANATRYATTMPIPVIHVLEIGYAL